jgi:hypothetical protein
MCLNKETRSHHTTSHSQGLQHQGRDTNPQNCTLVVRVAPSGIRITEFKYCQKQVLIIQILGNYDLYCELREVQSDYRFQFNLNGRKEISPGTCVELPALPLEAPQLNKAADRFATEFIAQREQHHATIDLEECSHSK